MYKLHLVYTTTSYRYILTYLPTITYGRPSK